MLYSFLGPKPTLFIFDLAQRGNLDTAFESNLLLLTIHDLLFKGRNTKQVPPTHTRDKRFDGLIVISP